MNEKSEVVVLIHGVLKTSAFMTSIESQLKKAGFQVININLSRRQKSLSQCVGDMHEVLQSVVCSKLHFVTHSRGGVVARAYIEKYQPETLGRVVQITPSNQGSELVDFAEKYCPFLSWLILGEARKDLTTYLAPQFEKPQYELGIIAADQPLALTKLVVSKILPEPHDGAVSLKSTYVEGCKAYKVLHENHWSIIKSDIMMKDMIHFLQKGAFLP